MESTDIAHERVMDLEERVSRLSKDPDILWGAQAIADVLGLSRREAYNYMTNGNIPAARKIGGRWCASRRELIRGFIAECREASNA